MPTKPNYHHGDLKNTLLESAASLLQSAGIQQLSLRDVAKHAGVSYAAPYHHFAGKEELISQLAIKFLWELDAFSQKKLKPKMPPEKQLEVLGTSYISFCIQNPAKFQLMFRPEFGDTLEQLELRQAPVLRLLLATIQQSLAGKKISAKQLPNLVFEKTITAWSLVHGFCSLIIDGPLGKTAGDAKAIAKLQNNLVKNTVKLVLS